MYLSHYLDIRNCIRFDTWCL